MNSSIHDVDILLVEDNPDDATLVMRALKKCNLGNNLIHLSDGEQALNFIFGKGPFSDRKVEDKPKVILLDLKMPKVDGLQVLKAIREDERTRAIPVVIMTSSGEEKDIVATYASGVNAYVVKPVGFDNFSKAVAELGMFWLLVNQSPK
ncbi:response regulator [Chryseosolibacter histidini]|jgi:CheY-like chemotaxis protein|uniref:response regulator n=1 Tax=Chryseosolibacter histidini TaxID=2782349 RepID=UPI0020B28E27|nr:response regulator [Chryseosolibacter histidini]